jgi:hypothetical protein
LAAVSAERRHEAKQSFTRARSCRSVFAFFSANPRRNNSLHKPRNTGAVVMTSERIPFLLASSVDQFSQLGSLLSVQPFRSGGHSK